MTDIKTCDECGRAPAIRYFVSRNRPGMKGVKMIGAADLCDVCMGHTPFLPIRRWERAATFVKEGPA